MPATLADEFARYLAAVTPAGETFSDVQVTEMRRCFYAGEFVLLSAVREIGTDAVSEDEGVARLEAMHREITAFYELVKAGRM